MKYLTYLIFSLFCLTSLSQTDDCYVIESDERSYPYNLLDRDSVEWTDKVIPVIIHVIHTGQEYGTFPNISDEIIFDQIDIINSIFRGNQSNVMDDTNISFCINKFNDPTHPEYGIQRHDITEILFMELNPYSWIINHADTLVKNYGIIDDTYLNIYVHQWTNGPNGFAYLWPSTKGVFVRTQYFIDDNPETTIHELGHFFGLKHTWEGYNDSNAECPSEEDDCFNEGDYVCDTPPTLRHYCENVCPVDDESVLPINFMGYGLGCRESFTYGQIDLMHSYADMFRLNYVNTTCEGDLACYCRWDLNNDGMVSLPDILDFLSVIFTNQDCENGDFDNSGFVDTSDFLDLLCMFSYDCISNEYSI